MKIIMLVKSSILYFIVSGLFLFGLPALAQDSGSGLFLEPAVTYEINDTSVNYPAPLSSSNGEVQGFGVGARLGFHIGEALFIGVDGRYSKPKLKDSDASYDATATSTNWGAVFGMQMPNLGLRVWGVYVFGGILDPGNSGDFDVKFEDAEGYRVGVGFRLAAISLNLEYQDLQYDKSTLERVGPFAPGTVLSGVNLESQSWIVSVSFPLEM